MSFCAAYQTTRSISILQIMLDEPADIPVRHGASPGHKTQSAIDPQLLKTVLEGHAEKGPALPQSNGHVPGVLP
jgi:hypothetical protein